jgi:hypothetical protein
MCLADLGVQLCRCQKRFGVLGVIAQDVGAEFHLAARLVDALAHLQRFEPGEVIPMGAQQRRCLVDDDRALGVRLVLPGLETSLCCGQRIFELVRAHVLETLDHLAGVGVDALVSHVNSLYP